jgi:hypothetical protein
MDVTIHTSVEQIPSWDEVAAPAGFYSSAGWLRLVHQAGTHYVAVRHAGAVLGLLPCFLAGKHPWTREVNEALVAAARVRLDAEAAILRQYRTVTSRAFATSSSSTSSSRY